MAEEKALYRRWRPQLFADLVGQNHVKQTLLNAIKTGKVSHAYLFAGPRGTGKTSMARLLAKAVNCLASKEGEPCGQCINCLALAEGRMMDLIEIDAASHTSVEDVRALIEKVNFTPSIGKYKVYIIDEVHMLSKSAFNALLKLWKSRRLMRFLCWPLRKCINYYPRWYRGASILIFIISPM